MTGVKRKVRCGGKPVTVIVLAGGRSRRMNADKALLPVHGETLVERVIGQVAPYFDEVLVSVSPGRKISIRQAIGPKACPGEERRPHRQAEERRKGRIDGAVMRYVVDEAPNQGPMAGLLAGLKAAANGICAVVACDIPDVHLPSLRKLVRAAAAAEIAVPITPEGQYEPLFAVYRKAVTPEIERLLRAGERSLIPLFGRCRTASVPLQDTSRLRNLNTRQEYEAYLRSFGPPPRKHGKSGRGEE